MDKRRRLDDAWQALDEWTNKRPRLPAVAPLSTRREHCDVCLSPVAYVEDGFQLCSNGECSKLFTDVLDHGAEWRTYGTDEHAHGDPTRCGQPIHGHASFGCRAVALPGSKLNHQMRKVCRFVAWQSACSHQEKTHSRHIQTILSLGTKAGLSRMILDQAVRFLPVLTRDHACFRGYRRDALIAASVYIACRTAGYTRSMKEIATMFELDVALATEGCKNATSILQMREEPLAVEERTYLNTATPAAFLRRYCSQLNLSTVLTNVCLYVAKRIHAFGDMQENTPPSTAAGIVYYVANACRIGVTKDHVHQVSRISEVTIGKCAKKIAELASQRALIPPKILHAYQR